MGPSVRQDFFLEQLSTFSQTSSHNNLYCNNRSDTTTNQWPVPTAQTPLITLVNTLAQIV